MPETSNLPEGEYILEVRGGEGGRALGGKAFTVSAREGFSLDLAETFAVPFGGQRVVRFAVNGAEAGSRVEFRAEWTDADGKPVGDPGIFAATADGSGRAEFPVGLRGLPGPGEFQLFLTAATGGEVVSRRQLPMAVVEDRGTPDLFMMIAGTRPSFYVYNDLQSRDAVATIQFSGRETVYPYAEYYGGIPRAPHLTDNLDLEEEHKWEDWTGEKISGGNGGAYSWALDEVLDTRDENLVEYARELEGKLVNPIILFDDEPLMPMAGGWEAADAFEEEYGRPAPIPEAKYDDPEYLRTWVAWEEFRAETWAEFYRRGIAAIHSVLPDYQTAVVVEGMGKDVYAGFEPTISQEPFGIYWFHIYPINEPMTMVGHAVERGMSALRAMGKEDRERFALLQNWAAVGNVPQVPGADYIRNQYWMAVAHGATGIGFWPYAYGWWTAAGTPGWNEMRVIAERQERLMPVWRELRADRDPIGLLYSQSQGSLDHLKGLLAETPKESTRPWRNYHTTDEAYHSLKESMLPFEVVEERELMRADPRELPYEVIVLAGVEYLRDETVEALTEFQENGGVIVGDESATVALSGKETLPAHFESVWDLVFPDDPTLFNRYKHRDDFKPISEENAAILRDALSGFDPGSIRISGEDVAWNTLRGGGARYLFVVNDSAHTPNLEKYRDTVQGWRLTPVEWSTVPVALSVEGQVDVYDLDAEKMVETTFEENRTEWSVALKPAGGKGYLVSDTWPDSLAVSTTGSVLQGEQLEWNLQPVDEAGEPVDIVLPIKLSWTAPGASEKVTRAATRGSEATGMIPVGADSPEGFYRLKVSVPGTSLVGETRFEVVANPEPLFSAGNGSNVSNFSNR